MHGNANGRVLEEKGANSWWFVANRQQLVVTIWSGGVRGARGGLQEITAFAGRGAQQIIVTEWPRCGREKRRKTVTQSILEMFLSRDAHSNNHDKN